MTEPSKFYKILAEKHNLTEEQIRSVIIYFWRTGVKRSLERIEHNEIYISKLGSFEIKDWKLKYSIPYSTALSKKKNMHENSVEYFSFLSLRLQEIENKLNEQKEKFNKFNELHNTRNIQEP